MQKVQEKLQKAVYCKQFTNSKYLHDLLNHACFSWCLLFFSKFLFFTKWYPFKNCEKCFLFHQKSSFRAQDIEIDVFSSSPFLFPVSHCLRGWRKKNLKIYDAINCLNKNEITHFVWYHEKEIRCDIVTLPIDRELNKEHFYVKIIQKTCFKS